MLLVTACTLNNDFSCETDEVFTSVCTLSVNRTAAARAIPWGELGGCFALSGSCSLSALVFSVWQLGDLE